MLRFSFATLVSILIVMPSTSFSREYLIPKSSDKNCEFYDLIGRQLSCSSNEDYCFQYGFKYCSKFQQLISNGDAGITKWVPKVTGCLQSALSDPFIYNEASSPTSVSVCERVRFKAFDSHPKCYVDSGFCELSPSSKQATFNIVAWADMLSNLRYSLAQALSVSEVCKVSYFDAAWMAFTKLLFNLTRDVSEDVKELAASIVVETPVSGDERRLYVAWFSKSIQPLETEVLPVAKGEERDGLIERLFAKIFGQSRIQTSKAPPGFLLKSNLQKARADWKKQVKTRSN